MTKFNLNIEHLASSTGSIPFQHNNFVIFFVFVAIIQWNYFLMENWMRMIIIIEIMI